MSCSRLSLGALALTFTVALAGLALAYGATTTALSQAETARRHLRETISAGLSAEHLPHPAGASAS